MWYLFDSIHGIKKGFKKPIPLVSCRFLFFAAMAPVLYNKGFNGNSQIGVFLGMCGIGLIAGSMVAVGVWSMMTGRGIMNMEQDMLNTNYATAVKMVQLVSTLFIFFIPAAAYAFICYKNGWLALGFNGKPILKITLISVLILIACTPAIDALTQLNRVIPLPAKSREFFDGIEKSYEQQVKVIGDVKSTGQYILSLFMIALLPAIFEETLFRGGMQNMLSRFKKPFIVYLVLMITMLVAIKAIWGLNKINPWIFYGSMLVIGLLIYRSKALIEKLNQWTGHFLFPILFTSILFSAIHASWYGFFPRLGLGLMLGFLFYYTQNLYYNILVHFLNNATVVTIMFISARQKKAIEVTQEFSLPLWTAVISVIALYFLYRLLMQQKVSETPMEVIADYRNPFNRTPVPEKEERELEAGEPEA